MPRETSSEPASTFGHSMTVGICSSCSAISVSVICCSACPYSVVTGCWLTSRNGSSVAMWPPTPSRSSQSRVERRAAVADHLRTRSIRGQPTTWTAVRILAEPDDPVGRVLVRRKMHVRELGDRVADALVDRAGHLPAHRVRERDVHVGARHGRGHRLEAIADGHDDVRLQQLEQRRQLEQPQPGGLRHRHRRLALRRSC